MNQLKFASITAYYHRFTLFSSSLIFINIPVGMSRAKSIYLVVSFQNAPTTHINIQLRIIINTTFFVL